MYFIVLIHCGFKYELSVLKKIILSECISERLFFELLAKMSSYKIDRVFVYHKGNRTRDKRNTFPPAAMVCREMNKANKAKYL